LRVLLDAQMIPGGLAGGMEQFSAGLVWALGRLTDGPEEYVVINHREYPEWPGAFLGPNQRIVSRPGPPPGRYEPVKRCLGPLRKPAGRAWREARRILSGQPKPRRLGIPVSDGFYESLGGDVIHFTYPELVQCQLPAIYNPHDVPYVSHAEFAPPEEMAARDLIYRAGCEFARAVATESEWAREGTARRYKLDAGKVYAIHRGAPTELYDPPSEGDLLVLRQRWALPESFAFYPARSWQHKNHLRLLEALRLVRDRHGQELHLVCTGRQTELWPDLAAHVGRLGLREQVHHLGYVTGKELRALYRLAQFLVFPSLYEAGGFPIVEALSEGLPVCCSALPPLKEYGGDALALFDPADPESIANALVRISRDATLRGTLRTRGIERARFYTWERTAKAYRALYRKVAGRPLSEEERQLIPTPPLPPEGSEKPSAEG
jgi:glycosyltransferase involved in cell wall biosynthesis